VAARRSHHSALRAARLLSGSWGYLSLRSGCALKDSRVSCLLITLSSSSALASLSRSISPFSRTAAGKLAGRGSVAPTPRQGEAMTPLRKLGPPSGPLGFSSYRCRSRASNPAFFVLVFEVACVTAPSVMRNGPP
jgi:hypothetical protein